MAIRMVAASAANFNAMPRPATVLVGGDRKPWPWRSSRRSLGQDTTGEVLGIDRGGGIGTKGGGTGEIDFLSTDYYPDKYFVGYLCESWDIKNPTTYVFHLRQGVKFHDGSDFNAEACAWNMNEQIAGKAAQFALWDSVKVIDNYTILLKLKNGRTTF
jgi:ABC-type transport system substrate-binding protein